MKHRKVLIHKERAKALLCTFKETKKMNIQNRVKRNFPSSKLNSNNICVMLINTDNN